MTWEEALAPLHFVLDTAKGWNLQNPLLTRLCVFSPDYIASSLQMLKELRKELTTVCGALSLYLLYFSILLLKVKPQTKNRQKYHENDVLTVLL